MVVSSDHSPAPTSIINQGIDRFLKHTFLVANDDLWCADLQQPPQAVIAIDHPAVEVVEVAGGKSAAIQLNHGA
jgi:hypothetical protein